MSNIIKLFHLPRIYAVYQLFLFVASVAKHVAYQAAIMNCRLTSGRLTAKFFLAKQHWAYIQRIRSSHRNMRSLKKKQENCIAERTDRVPVRVNLSLLVMQPKSLSGRPAQKLPSSVW